ncbi:hypothetical protein CHS0354_042402 [Potamilus streckersoni]|uniref:Uncharacterized protein n=1 Tax=Potamilus streckersoni TaxID=2493646 RepID=A0AAE0W1U1_9BIVA|nr:hypothetical protein CHS0354_042402 [Potamilus streckersoni]
MRGSLCEWIAKGRFTSSEDVWRPSGWFVSWTRDRKVSWNESCNRIKLGRVLVAQLGEPITLSFIATEETISSIKIVDPITSRRVLIYNVAERDCIYTDIIQKKQLQVQCCVSKREFSFTIPYVSWLHKGGYFAWDDKGHLLDSIFVDIEGKATEVETEDFPSKRHMLYIILGMGATLAAAFLACLVYKIRTCLRIVRASKINTSTVCNKDDGENNLQEGYSLGHYDTIESSEIGELNIVVGMDFGQHSEPSLIRENLVSANVELEHSMGPESIRVNVDLHNVPNSIESPSVEFNNYLQLI